MRKPSFRATIDEITVERGETLTVWLNTAHFGKRKGIQVELRVDKDGQPEIFNDGLKIQSMDKWKAL